MRHLEPGNGEVSDHLSHMRLVEIGRDLWAGDDSIIDNQSADLHAVIIHGKGALLFDLVAALDQLQHQSPLVEFLIQPRFQFVQDHMAAPMMSSVRLS